MPRSLFVRLLAAAALAAGCAGRTAAPPATPADTTAPAAPAYDIAGEATAVRGVVSLFVSAEAENAASADTLLTPGADVLMTGVQVTTRPRLAGLNGPGRATVEEASTGLAGHFAWVVVRYRFSGRTPELAERARATFVLEKQRAGWKIRHVHSSMVARW